MAGIFVNFEIKKKEINEKLKRVLFIAMIDVQNIAKQKAPVDTGRLRNSIKLFPSTAGSLEYFLIATVDYAEDIEYGTSPHFVSAKELKDWARRKLGNEEAAFGVAKKIRRLGTNAQPFMRPALLQVKEGRLKNIFSQMF